MDQKKPDRLERIAHVEEIDPDIFVARLNRIVNEIDISMGDISVDSGCARDIVASYLRGERLPNARTLMNLCNYLNVSADWLLGLSNERRAVW